MKPRASLWAGLWALAVLPIELPMVRTFAGAPGYFVARIRNPRGPIPVGGYLFIRLLPRLGAIRSSVLSGNNAIFASSACCQSTDRVKVESTTTKFDLGCLFVSVTDETQIGQFEVAVR